MIVNLFVVYTPAGMMKFHYLDWSF